MKPNWLNAHLSIKLGAVIGLGVLAAWFVPTEAYRHATGVLASFAGVVVAALVPTMILAATILRPVSKGKNEFRQVRNAVSTQISFFSGLFLMTIVLAALLFVGSLADWSDIGIGHSFHLTSGKWEIFIPLIRILGGAVVSISFLIAIQMFGFVQGIRNLFSLHADNTEKELDRIIEAENRAIKHATLPPDPRTGIGEDIGQLKH